MHRPIRPSTLVPTLLALAIAVPLRAEVLEEIVVTAQKREQSLQDVGLSVTAFTGKQVEELGFTTTTDVTNFTPGLNYTTPQAEGSQINFFLRGVGLNDFTDANENPVAAYFDEVYRGAMGGLSMQLFDIDRIEVLRGPQGTLYGRNTTGGLVHFISKRPTEQPEGYAQVSVGEYDQVQFEGAISGPLNDKVAGRLSISTNDHSGYVKNRHPGVGDYNEMDAEAARGQLLWKAGEDVNVLLQAHASRNSAQVGAWQNQPIVATNGGDDRAELGPNEINPLCPVGPGLDCFGYRDTDGDPWAGDFDRDGRVQVKAEGASAHVDWDIGEGLKLVNITAVDHVERLQEEDTDAGPYPLILPTFQAETQQFTEELRLHGDNDSSRWVTGLYYYNQFVNADYDLDLSNLGFVVFSSGYTQNTNSWSAFGQYEYELTEQWKLIGGLRYTQEDRELDYLNVDTSGFFTGVIGLPSNVAFDFDRNSVGDLAKHDESNVTGRLELDYKPADDWLWYASISKGAKSAGFNTGFLDSTLLFASNTVATIPFDEETLYAYEVGFKSTLLDGRARLNGSAFYYDYQDFQTFRFELLNQIIFNTDAEVYGGELELQASPWKGWDFAAGLSLMDATAKDIPASISGTPTDRHMVAAPDLSFSALARYEWDALGGKMAALVKAKYQDETWFDIQNYATARQDGYTVADLRLQWTSGDDRWQLAAFVDNVTDEEYLVYTFDFVSFGFNQQAYGKPRWAGASLMYRWE